MSFEEKTKLPKEKLFPLEKDIIQLKKKKKRAIWLLWMLIEVIARSPLQSM